MIDDRDPDPPEHPAERVGIGEDVVRRLPVGVLVGVAEARHAKRRAVSKRSAEVYQNGAVTDCRLDCGDDPRRIIAQQPPRGRRVVRPAARAAVCRKKLRKLPGRFVAKRDKIDRLAPLGRFLGAARRHHLADDGWQHRRRILPADQVEALERFVDEIERVSVVGEGPLGLGREKGVVALHLNGVFLNLCDGRDHCGLLALGKRTRIWCSAP